ncbi:MAG: ATP-binding protein [Candidatus Aminicenantes bacterium]|nr:ATP-binding protein [Candidatus Aminicenantes bacterium]
MKAQNLKDAIKAFDPSPLEETEVIDSFYISRGRNLTELFNTLGDQSIKVLFSGHRGSGKTTELNYTATSLASKYTIFNLKVGRHLDFDKAIESRDILRAIFYAAKPASESLEKTKKTVREIIKEVFSSLSIPLDFGISGPSTKDYLLALNKAIDAIEKKTGKKILLFVDDLDKQVHGIEKVLLEEGKVFDEIACSLVLTVPLTTIYSTMANRVTEWFSRVEVLPVIPPFNKDGSLNSQGLEMLQSLVHRRMGPSLIAGSALETACLNSGGVFRYLVKIIQDSTFKALWAGKDKITSEDVDKSINTMRSEFGRTIGFGDYDKLREIHEKKNLINIETDVRFISNDIVLEYQGATRWVDVHPIVKDLLPGD